MARKKAPGSRAKGIQGKQGLLYIVTCKKNIIGGVTTYKRVWISTGLKDTPENVKTAISLRETLINNKSDIDRNITANDYVDLYLSQKKRELADTTYANYTNWTKRFTEYFNGIPLRKITKDDIQGYLDYLIDNHNYQLRSLKDTKMILSSIYEKAVEDGIVTKNIVAEAKINKDKASQNAKDKGDDDFFDYDQVVRFLKIIENHPLYYAFYLIVFLGLRREELLGLKWGSINIDGNTLRITSTVTKGTKINRNNTTKTATSRRVYEIPDSLVTIFKRLKAMEDENRALFGNKYNDNDYVIKKADGSLYYPDSITKAFKKIINKHPELPQYITLHGLRKSCVSILVHDGKDIKSIQAWVGQKDTDTTLKIYARIKEKEAKKEVSNRLSELLPLKDDKTNTDK